jgi:hypothetical protein
MSTGHCGEQDPVPPLASVFDQWVSTLMSVTDCRGVWEEK